MINSDIRTKKALEGKAKYVIILRHFKSSITICYQRKDQPAALCDPPLPLDASFQSQNWRSRAESRPDFQINT